MLNIPFPWESLKKIHDHFASVAIKCCDEGQEVAPQLFLVDALDSGEVRNMAVFPPEMVAFFFENGVRGKDMFAQLLHDLLKPGHPTQEKTREQLGFTPRLLVHVCEAWASVGKSLEDMEGNYVPPSQDPQRKECILVTLHMAGTSIPTMHVIETEPKRHAVKGEFPSPDTIPLFSGRLSMQDSFGPEGSVH